VNTTVPDLQTPAPNAMYPSSGTIVERLPNDFLMLLEPDNA